MGQPLEHVVQVGEGIYLMLVTTRCHTEQDRCCLRSFVAPGEQPVGTVTGMAAAREMVMAERRSPWGSLLARPSTPPVNDSPQGPATGALCRGPRHRPPD